MELEKVPGVKLSMKIANEDLRRALSTLPLRDPSEASWCIACGASKGTKPIDRVSLPESFAPQLMDPVALTTFVKSMKELGEKAWCIACGAGKDTSPLDQIVNPADIPDSVIEDLAMRLIQAVKVG